MYYSTLDTVDGRPHQQLGLVTGKSVTGFDWGLTEKARERELRDITKQAEDMGADAIVGFNITATYLNERAMLLTFAGTAVRFAD